MRLGSYSIALFLLLAAGCGGGGGEEHAVNGGSQTLSLGMMSITASGPLAAIGGTGSATVVGLAGANITSAVLNPAKRLDQTKIALVYHNYLSVMNPDGTNLTVVDTDTPNS